MTAFNDEHITLFAETNFRGVKRRFGIKRKDRRRHMYIIGKTGMGKTTLLENMTIQDIQSGEGVGIVDPHGEYAERMLDFVPASRMNDVVYFNPSDLAFPLAFNVMEDVGPERRHLVSSGLLGVFKKIWGPEVWSGRMEYLLSNSILALLETPGTTLLGINRILADKEFRKRIVSNVKDPIVKAFWENEYARYTEKFATEAGAAVQNKIGQFTSNPLIRNIIGQQKSTIDMRTIMDERKIFIMNLSKGRIGEENARLLGAMLITRLYLSAMTRIDIPEDARPDFYLYVDEFQNFATESFANILSEARKYHLDLILAHQYVEQMDEGVRAAVFGNVGSMATFRIGAADAELLEKEFSPEFMIQDLVNLGFASIYLRLMIDGVASRPFSASTLPPVQASGPSYRSQIIAASQKTYGRDRSVVEREIMEWQGFGEKTHLQRSDEFSTAGPIIRVRPDQRPEGRQQGRTEGIGTSASNPERKNEAIERFFSRPVHREQPALPVRAHRPLGDVLRKVLPEASPNASVREEKTQHPPFRSGQLDRSFIKKPDGASSAPPASPESVRLYMPQNEKGADQRFQPKRQQSEHASQERTRPQPPASRGTADDQNRSPYRVPQEPSRIAEKPLSLSPHQQADRFPQSRDEDLSRRNAQARALRQQSPQDTSSRRAFLDIRSAPRAISRPPQPSSEASRAYTSLSRLHAKESADSTSSPAKPSESKKAVNFSELKKVLRDSFGVAEKREERQSIVHDKTGMLNQRASGVEPPRVNPPDADSKAKGSSAGVLKPGERVRF